MIDAFRRVAEVAALVVGAGMVLLGCSLVGVAQGYQKVLSAKAAVTLVSAIADASGTNEPVLPVESVAVLRLRRLRQELFVLPDTGNNLIKGPVWLARSRPSALDGNIIVAAHRDTHFLFLKDVVVGDRFELLTRSGRSTYAVNKLSVVHSEDRRMLRSQSSSVLTLVTCYPFNFIGRAPQRFVVRAHLVTGKMGADTDL